MLYDRLQVYVNELVGEYHLISESRRAVLVEIAEFVQTRLQRGQKAELTFICTHNSRRSHMSQIWARTAATWYQIPDVNTYSGGTETTAFNPRAVAALQRAGFDISPTTKGENPIYRVGCGGEPAAWTAFSKVFDQAPNPRADYAAVMTCGQADQACPVVFGAAARIALTYDDPKAADDTPDEARVYDERVRQIGRELLYAFSVVAA